MSVFPGRRESPAPAGGGGGKKGRSSGGGPSKSSSGSDWSRKKNAARKSSSQGMVAPVRSLSRRLVRQVGDEGDGAEGDDGDGGDGGVRLNKCLTELSRRAADEAIAEGRVTINSSSAPPGSRVRPGDVVRLDGQMQHWEISAEARAEAPARVLEDRAFIYVKYWKPVGVTCTSDPKDRSNIIKAGQFDLFPQRLFTVGRLDKDSSGLILLTSDGRVNNAMLSPLRKKDKVYIVDVNRAPSERQLESLRSGVVISTTAQRDSGSRPMTAKTKACGLKRIPAGDPTSRRLEFTLTEGRNRQIRRMCESQGLRVTALHRIHFAGIGLRGLARGNWCELDEGEMRIIQQALRSGGGGGVGGVSREDEEE